MSARIGKLQPHRSEVTALGALGAGHSACGPGVGAGVAWGPLWATAVSLRRPDRPHGPFMFNISDLRVTVTSLTQLRARVFTLQTMLRTGKVHHVNAADRRGPVDQDGTPAERGGRVARTAARTAHGRAQARRISQFSQFLSNKNAILETARRSPSTPPVFHVSILLSQRHGAARPRRGVTAHERLSTLDGRAERAGRGLGARRTTRATAWATVAIRSKVEIVVTAHANSKTSTSALAARHTHGAAGLNTK